MASLNGIRGRRFRHLLRHHNPFTYLSAVQNSSSQAANIAPLSQFAADLNNNALPQYSFMMVPDGMNDAHYGSLAQADAWLQANIAPLLANSAFQSNGLLVITFDEEDQSDMTNSGGRVATLIISSQVKPG